MDCPNCGQTAQTESARCGHCNFKLPEQCQAPAGPASELLACWNCALPNPPEATRCTHCNAKVRDQPLPAGNRFSLTQHPVSHEE